MGWYLYALSRYATFTGRARRREFWWFAIFSFIFYIIIGVFEAASGGPVIAPDPEAPLYLFSTLYGLFNLIPGLAVSVRRLHDTGRSGWWLLLILVPLLGCVLLLVVFLLDSERGPNVFGANPKYRPI